MIMVLISVTLYGSKTLRFVFKMLRYGNAIIYVMITLRVILKKLLFRKKDSIKTKYLMTKQSPPFKSSKLKKKKDRITHPLLNSLFLYTYTYYNTITQMILIRFLFCNMKSGFKMRLPYLISVSF